MKNLRRQDGCWNCKHRFVLRDYEDADCYYCASDGVERPPSTSVLMDELSHMVIGRDSWRKAMQTFDKWAATRSVEPYDTCDLWAVTEDGG